MKICLHTLGCKVNQFESGTLVSMFKSVGWQVAEFPALADVYVINTCTVTAMGDKKSRNAIRRARQLNPDALLVVCGCYPKSAAPAELEALGIDIISGPGDKQELFRQILEKTGGLNEACPDFELAFATETRTRALLKVQDGCRNFCSYCIIPHTRPTLRSLPVQQALEQCRVMQDNGFKEVVICGIEVASYGRDFTDKTQTLAGLVDQLCRAFPDIRFRLGSLKPTIITRDFCRTLAAHKNLCNHFHVSLQSGSDAILKRMNRGYTSDTFYQNLQNLRRHFPGCAITTDIIVGFPGETPADFQATVTLTQKCEFSQIHVFPYSRRQNTPAASFEGQVPNAEKKLRAAELAQVGQQLRQQYLTGQIGQTLTVLTERDNMGHSENYLPVRLKNCRENSLVQVKIESLDDFLISE